ncbi:MAG: hypothetical protein JWO36_3371 [Myxococcales bacterium]|nr:hypothetical protein [Myxococcales bacterium]
MSARSVWVSMPVFIAIVITSRDSDAQIPEDPLAPVRCVRLATDRNLSTQSALELCAGAASDAPALCFAMAHDRGDLTEGEGVMLCQQATSTRPVECYDDLDRTTLFSDYTIVEYCAPSCGYNYPTEGSDPGCVRAALERYQISEQQALTLCQGSTSAAPATCLDAGESETQLSDNQLIDLCAPVNYLACQQSAGGY